MFKPSVTLSVRETDVISGKRAINADHNNLAGFKAAHIFPLAFEGLWNDFDYGRWIKCPSNEEIKGGKINSVQNGLLLRSDIHQLFDVYLISINPEIYIHTPCGLL